MAMGKRIIMPVGGRLQLAREFGVTTRMIYKALNYAGNSKLAQSIRAVALERGGELYEKVPTDKQQTNAN